MKKWIERAFFLLVLIGGGYAGHACDEKWPTPTSAQRFQSGIDSCKKLGAQHYSTGGGCIFDIPTGPKPDGK